MMFFHRLLSTGLGIGYLGRGAGTFAALACCAGWYLLAMGPPQCISQLLVLAAVIPLGIWSAGKVEKQWGKDHQRVVIDEIAGMCVSLFCVPVQLPGLLAAFILFRFFDIAKPLFIRRLEKLPGGWGVMADDILAGVYANLLLRLAIAMNLLK
jgi:phosphatidylglycerophosphatase A